MSTPPSLLRTLRAHTRAPASARARARAPAPVAAALLFVPVTTLHDPLWPPDAPPPPPPVSWSPSPSPSPSFPASQPIPNPPSTFDRYRHVWWVLDPQHAHQCFDCQQLAAHSPYALATLYQMPGDGHTYCGHDCTCIVSFLPPEQTYPPGPPLPPDALTTLQRLLRVYTHGQVWYLALSGAIPTLLALPSNRGWPRPDTVPDAHPDQARSIPPGHY